MNPDPILGSVPTTMLQDGPRLLRWLEKRGLPHPTLLAVDAERRRRSTTTPTEKVSTT